MNCPRGRGNKKGRRSHIVAIDPRYFRPTEVAELLGDPSKAKNLLGWSSKTSFDDLVAEMVQEDLKLIERESLIEERNL